MKPNSALALLALTGACRGAGANAVRNNRVRQIIQCKENRWPFVGGPNQAAEAEGQCR